MIVTTYIGTNYMGKEMRKEEIRIKEKEKD